jgi:hypothetical protein
MPDEGPGMVGFKLKKKIDGVFYGGVVMQFKASEKG